MEPEEPLIPMSTVMRALKVMRLATLRRWLRNLGISPHVVRGRQYITPAELDRLRSEVAFHRSLNWRESMQDRVIALEARLEHVEQQYRNHLGSQSSSQREIIRILLAASTISDMMCKVAEYIEDATDLSRASAGDCTIALSAPLEAVLVSAADSAFVQRLRTAIHTALARGWTVRHLICQTDEIESNYTVALGLVKSILEYLHGGDSYVPCFYAASDLPTDTWRLAVPNVREDVDGYIFIEGQASFAISVKQSPAVHPFPVTSEATKVIRERLEPARDRSWPLFRQFTPTNTSYLELITEADQTAVSRGLFMHGLSQTTMPVEVHNKRAAALTDKYPHLAAAIERIRSQHVRRIEILDNKLELWKVSSRLPFHDRFIRDICPMSALERYIRTGIPSKDDSYAHLGIAQDTTALLPEQVDEHLAWVIKRLSYPNYELALFHDTSPSLHPLRWRPFWMVSEGHSVILEVHKAVGATQVHETDLVIREQVMVQAFLSHFVDIWDKGDQLISNKDQVIEWLSQARNRIDFHRTH